MKKFDVAFPLTWLILLLKPEFRAADYRAILDKGGKSRTVFSTPEFPGLYVVLFLVQIGLSLSKAGKNCPS